jgi:hypothetical protein
MDPDIPTLDETVKSGKQRLGFSRLRLKNPIKMANGAQDREILVGGIVVVTPLKIDGFWSWCFSSHRVTPRFQQEQGRLNQEFS